MKILPDFLAVKVNFLIRRLMFWRRVLLRNDFYITKDIKIKTRRYGSDYGGWEISTLGINENSIVYSFGVGEDASFDIELIEQYRLTVHAFDPTPRSIDWVNSQNIPKNFIMHNYGISNFDGEAKFTPPENPDHVSHTLLERPHREHKAISVSVKKLNSIINDLKHSEIDILKLDIEGAEYNVIKDLIESDIRPKQILVEFHHRFPNIGIEESQLAIKQLKDNGYKLFSVSISNEEFCFIYDKG